MGSQKSSITAQIKVAGLSAFKSDLGAAGQSASKLGKELQAIKPITFDGGASSAKRAATLREEHHKASLRVIEREEKLHQQRLQVLGNPKGGIGRVGMGGGARADGAGRGAATGGGGGGLGAGGNAAQAYNFIQDLAQGGPAAVANNMPWLIQAVAGAWKSPAVVAAASAVGAGIAAAASVGLAAKLGYDVFTEEDKAFDRSQKNRNESRKKWDKINTEKDKKAAKDKALIVGEIEGKNQALISEGAQRKVKEIGGADGGERAMKLQAELRQIKIDAIEDPATKARESAAEEKNQINESIKLLRAKAEEVDRVAKAELESARSKEKTIKDELALQGNTARTPEEINRRIQLEATLTEVIKRRAEAEKMAFDESGGLGAVNKKEQEGQVEKKIIEEKTNTQLKEIEKEKSRKTEEDNANKKDAIDRFQEELAAVEKEGKAKEAERQKVREQMAGEERKSRMSPRQLAKQEAKDRIKGQTEELVNQGFRRSEAEGMARGAETRRERTQTDTERAAAGLRPRIRGVGYQADKQESFGIGGAKFSGLEGLESMQAPGGRKAIQGVGSKKKGQASFDKQEGGWQTLVNAILQVKQSVDKLTPNASDKSKPRSTSAR